ncbi:putative plant SNARE 13 [Dichanthelium oligosanthes]|uniref:Putative plant SNARE 13 n=1 Tax=Dichanthelium oligosanthes TaxID=888268 RepID=A0A1E5VCT8_9POAL|nr:putative plant SNARE 13 [Dichanthelium oligosanthes]
MASDVPMSPELEQVDGEIQDIFRALQNGFQKMDKIKDSNRQSKQLEDLTGKMRECKRLIEEFDRILKDEEKKNSPDVNKQLNDKKQFMIKELNSYITLRKTDVLLHFNSLRSKMYPLQPFEPMAEMSNQELINAGRKQMDQTDQAIERSKMVVAQTVEVGAQTAATLTQQTEQMKRIGNELDSVHFSLKKASQMVKEIGRQVATDKCIMAFLFLIVCGVIAIIVVKIVNPHNKSIRDIPGLAPPAMNRKLLSIDPFGGL